MLAAASHIPSYIHQTPVTHDRGQSTCDYCVPIHTLHCPYFSVDRATDAVIQEALRDFTRADPAAGRVLLVIAHRIDTVMECDQLLVLSAGELIEQGGPEELAGRQGGMFAAMVASAKGGAHDGASHSVEQKTVVT